MHFSERTFFFERRFVQIPVHISTLRHLVFSRIFSKLKRDDLFQKVKFLKKYNLNQFWLKIPEHWRFFGSLWLFLSFQQICVVWSYFLTFSEKFNFFFDFFPSDLFKRFLNSDRLWNVFWVSPRDLKNAEFLLDADLRD